MSIKCTYEDCYKTFKSQDLMIKHKTKEPEHHYCKRCDVDCKDDIDFLIHQIQSNRHTCCPICGLEFQSKAGRDSHVEVNHPRKQKLECPGCQIKLTGAAGLMSHIEKDECEIIRVEDFQRQAAEKEVQRDAWTQALDSSAIASALPSCTSNSDQGGVTLLDGVSGDWARGSVSDKSLGSALQPSRNGAYVPPKPLLQGMGALTLDKFPTLISQSSRQDGSKISMSKNDLLDLDELEQRIPDPRTRGIWHSEDGAGNLRLPPRETHNSNVNSTTRRAEWQPRREISEPGRPENRDPNAPYAHVRTAPSLSVSNGDPHVYYDHIQKQFICPGAMCGGHYDTAEAFTKHLTEEVHVSSRKVCPRCLKKFNSTTALLAHCESGSKRCDIRNTAEYNQVLRTISGGVLGTDGHMNDGSVRYVANRIENW